MEDRKRKKKGKKETVEGGGEKKEEGELEGTKWNKGIWGPMASDDICACPLRFQWQGGADTRE